MKTCRPASGRRRSVPDAWCADPQPDNAIEATPIASDRLLLNEPRCFECRCLGGEPLKPRDRSVTKPEDIGLVGLDSNVAAAPERHDPRLGDDRMTEVDELVRLPLQFRKQ